MMNADLKAANVDFVIMKMSKFFQLRKFNCACFSHPSKTMRTIDIRTRDKVIYVPTVQQL